MGEAVQKKKKNENENNGDGGGGGKKKEEIPFTVVLKIDMHCEGCANKITKCVKGFEGVQSVKAEIDGNKLTVTGKKIDATKLREKLSNKTKKKVDLISPQPKKEKDSKPKDKIDDDQTSSNNNKSDKKTDENKKKSKEPPVTTAVLKVSLHCQGCIEKIQRVTTKFKGVQEMSVDRQKDLVTVKGTMDVKALSGSLTERLKRPVEIVPMKKEKDNNKNEGGGGGGDKKDPAATGDGNGNGNGGGKKKKKGGNGGGGGGDGNGGEDGCGGKMEGNKMEYMGMVGIGYGHGYGYGYGPGGLVGENLHAPQLFSDENPNACFIM
ncbi:heavy metal-associated isoprenylated plant protein 3-like [Benincasa hispida]|uniref:heavy metal-associated isoprenylated plant protein 3-like n=1 Tax=Benincasa hispida TaxID=102211 RepID=UPI001902A10C|nr:heavy metal-associated isoprenylated plant protein 3-like [Benincasa hispida]